MLFQGKLMNQTSEKNKKLNFRFGPNLSQKSFFVGFTPTRYYALLRAITVCYFKGKLMSQTGENSKKSSFGQNFGPFSPKSWSSKPFFVRLNSTRC